MLTGEQILQGSLPHGGPGIFEIVITAQHGEFGMEGHLLDIRHQLEPVHLRHFDIGNNQIGLHSCH